MSLRTRRATRRITLQISTKVYTCRITFRLLVNMRLTRFATSTHKRYVKMTYPLFSSLPTQSGAGARMWPTPHNVIVSMSVVLSQMSCRPIALTVLRKVTSNIVLAELVVQAHYQLDVLLSAVKGLGKSHVGSLIWPPEKPTLYFLPRVLQRLFYLFMFIPDGPRLQTQNILIWTHDGAGNKVLREREVKRSSW